MQANTTNVSFFRVNLGSTAAKIGTLDRLPVILRLLLGGQRPLSSLSRSHSKKFRGINFEKGWHIVFVLASTSPYLTLRLSSVHICRLAVRVRAPKNEMQCHGYPFRSCPWCIFVNLLYHLIRARCVTIRLIHATSLPRKSLSACFHSLTPGK